MENKKGFTLIEMLGILVVLSVIVLVSLPSVIQSNREAKQRELADAEQTILMAAETYIELNDAASRSLDEKNYYYVSLATLISEGLLANNLENPHENAGGQDISKGDFWVEARTNKGNTIYNLVEHNPYAEEEYESEYAHNMLLSSGQVSRDKLLNGGKSNRLVYNGPTPNNYLRFNNELWRIVALEEDGTIKIAREELLDGSRDFEDALSYLNGAYYDNFTPAAKDMIVEKDYNYGVYDFSNLADIASVEAGNKYKAKIGLLSMSDYVNASEGDSCTASASYGSGTAGDPCSVQNYLYKNARWWLMHSATGGNAVISDGTEENVACSTATESQKNNMGLNSYPSTCKTKVRPTLYLKEQITISSGNGSLSNPYIVTLM